MKYEYWFANIKEISNKRKREIRQGMKSLEMLYYIEETQLKRLGFTEREQKGILESIKRWRINEEYEKLKEKNVKIVSVAQEMYPKRLLPFSGAPYALYVKGVLPSESKKTVAIVGARECSPYGVAMAREFSRTLAAAGVEIVSGMARGIDSVSQRAALGVEGASFAVLGSGVDICYPREEIGLYMELQERGGILSEFPLGTRPLAKHFPARNRIISGLADAVIVIEAKEKSGSLITADMALEQGKDVYALPGPANSSLSKGCNMLIKQGAGLLLTPEELLEEWGYYAKSEKENFASKKIPLESTQNIVYSCLGFHPQNLEELMERTKLEISELLNALMALELRGLMKEIAKNHYVKIE